MSQPRSDTHEPLPPGFTLHRDVWGHLVLADSNGCEHHGVDPVRLFPFSHRDGWVALCDPNGREIVLVEDPDSLPPSMRSLLLEELARREFVPVIERIEAIRGSTPPYTWSVETDRGPCRFTISGDDQVRSLGPGRILVTDVTGLRFQIPDSHHLDPLSRRLLEKHL